jgi:CRISPR/Cas system-associated protein Cas10 (large subunit of type III CRISPR-Cas system)
MKNDSTIQRAVMITFEVFEKLHQRKCFFCGSEDFSRICAKVGREFSLNLALCEACYGLFYIL